MTELGIYALIGMFLCCVRLWREGDLSDRYSLGIICTGLALIVLVWPLFILLWISDLLQQKR
jgi:hypothetical protein